jgi:hypothetical protein
LSEGAVDNIFEQIKNLRNKASEYKNEPLAESILTLLESVFLESYRQDLESHLKNIITDLSENGIDYAVIGGIALRMHNFPRLTEDIDLLISKDTFPKIENILIGKGYTFRPGSHKNLYYHVGEKAKIQVDILIEGDKEGDILLPDPKEVRQKMSSIWVLTLPKLIEFKLGAGRGRDKNDVLRLIEYNDLTVAYAQQIDEKYRKEFLDLLEQSSQGEKSS